MTRGTQHPSCPTRWWGWGERSLTKFSSDSCARKRYCSEGWPPYASFILSQHRFIAVSISSRLITWKKWRRRAMSCWQSHSVTWSAWCQLNQSVSDRTDTRRKCHAAAMTHLTRRRAGDVVTCPSIEITRDFWPHRGHRQEATGLIQCTVWKQQGTVTRLSLQGDAEDRWEHPPSPRPQHAHTHTCSPATWDYKDDSWMTVGLWANPCTSTICSVNESCYYASLGSLLKQVYLLTWTNSPTRS